MAKTCFIELSTRRSGATIVPTSESSASFMSSSVQKESLKTTCRSSVAVLFFTGRLPALREIFVKERDERLLLRGVTSAVRAAGLHSRRQRDRGPAAQVLHHHH